MCLLRDKSLQENGLEGGGNLSSNVTLTADFEDNVPLVGTSGGSAGTSNELARGDHQHPPVDLSDSDETNGVLPINSGGTGRSNTSRPGSIAYGGGSDIALGSVGLAGQVLISGGAGAYTWGSALIQTDQPANVVFSGPVLLGLMHLHHLEVWLAPDLPNSGATAGSYGSSNLIPVITVDAKGIITGVTTATFQTGLDYQGNLECIY